METALGLTEKLANDRPISSWLGSAPLTPLLLNRHSSYLRRLSHRSGTPQLSRGNSFVNPHSGTVSRANSFNNGPLSRGNSFNSPTLRVNSARGSFRDVVIPKLSTTPRDTGASAPWVPLSPNHEAIKTRQPTQRNLRNTINDPQSRRRSTQFFESAFTGGATDDFLSRRSPTAATGTQSQSQFGVLSSKRRASNFPQLSTGIGSPIIPPLLSASILPPSLQGISPSTSPEKKTKN